MKHLDEAELSALLDGASPLAARDAAERHLADCATCRDALAALRAQEAELARALAHDPGEAYFASFANRVEQRIRAQGATMEREAESPSSRAPLAPASLPWFERLSQWLSGPRLAWSGATLALVVAAGVVRMVYHEQPIEKLRDSELVARGGQVAQGALPSGERSGVSAPAPSSASAPVMPNANAPAAPLSQQARRDQDTRAHASGDANGTLAGGAPPAQPPLAKSTNAPPSNAGGVAQEAAPRAAFAPAPGATAQQTARLRETRRDRGEETATRSANPMPVADQLTPQPTPAQTRLQRLKQFAAPSPLAGAPSAESPATQNEVAAPSASRALARDASGAVRVCGAVRDQEGHAITGARITIADLGLTTRSDDAGHWCLDVPGGERTLSVMAVGFRENRTALHVAPGMSEEVVMLAAVSVMGGASAPNARFGYVGAGTPPKAPAPWTALQRPLAVTAGQLSATARSNGKPDAYDRAADAWERLTVRVGKGANAGFTRRTAADLRYRAWQLAPTAARAQAAITALQIELETAATPSERARVETRIQQLRASSAER